MNGSSSQRIPLTPSAVGSRKERLDLENFFFPGEKLYYYDANSLYPYIALQDLPGTKCHKESFTDINKQTENLFGFHYCPQI